MFHRIIFYRAFGGVFIMAHWRITFKWLARLQNIHTESLTFNWKFIEQYYLKWLWWEMRIANVSNVNLLHFLMPLMTCSGAFNAFNAFFGYIHIVEYSVFPFRNNEKPLPICIYSFCLLLLLLFFVALSLSRDCNNKTITK